MPTGSSLCTHLPPEGLSGPFEERVVSPDLVDVREGAAELRTCYPSEIQLPFYRVWSRRAVSLGGLDPLGASHLVLPYSIPYRPSDQFDRLEGGLWPSARLPQENVSYDLGRGTEQITYGLVI
jgi:hypothetical protein